MSPVIEECPACQAPVADGELFCEGCGADLSAVVPAPAAAVDGVGQVPAPAGPPGVGSGAVGAAPGGPGTGPAATGADPTGEVPADPAQTDPAPTDPVVDPGAADPGAADPGAAGPLPSGPGAGDPAPDGSGTSPGPGEPWVRVDEQDLSARAGYCVHCRGPVADDGYCSRCGAPAPLPRDHWRERPAPWVAAVCDRGIRHPHNEDAVAVAAARPADSFAALVVCDGVSSSTGSDRASLAAVRAAREVLVAAAVPPGSAPGEGAVAQPATGPEPVGETPGPGPDPALTPDPALGADPTGTADPTTPAGPVPDQAPTPAPAVSPTPEQRARAEVLAAAMVEAGLRGNAAVVTTAGDPPGPNPPSCTFVAAVVEDALVVTGWVGDSRVYWLPDTGPAEQLSADDSWAGEAIAAGIPREDAERAPQAHAITRWFGVDAPDPRPHTAARVLDRPGWVLVCSDGLWNYCSPAAALQNLVAQAVQQLGDDPGDLASGLVDWAKQQGGHDNITVALARVRSPRAAG